MPVLLLSQLREATLLKMYLEGIIYHKMHTYIKMYLELFIIINMMK